MGAADGQQIPNMTQRWLRTPSPFPSPPQRAGGSGLFERLDALLLFSPEEAQIHDGVGEFAHNEIAPRAEHYDRSAEFPWHNAASSG
jgi:hypothetical protein